jgi:23S rRNA pseudoU1915 N3-methylase RlmH
MMLPLIGFGGLSAMAWWKSRSKSDRPKVLSPNMQYTLEKLLDAKLTAEKYIKAAEHYEKHGYKEEGQVLRKRAKLAALPKEEKDKLASAFGLAMASQRPEGIRSVANVFEARGAIGAAKTLRSHADEVEAANSVQAVPHPVQEAIIAEQVAADQTVAETAAHIESLAGTIPEPVQAVAEADAATGPPPTPGTNVLPDDPEPMIISDGLDTDEEQSDSPPAEDE